MPSIRRGTLDDIPQIMQIVRAVVPIMEAVNNFQWGSHNKFGVFYPNEESFTQDVNDGTLWVVESDTDLPSGESSVVAVAALTVDQPEEYIAAGLDLSIPAVVPHRLAVHPAFQGHGLANLLLDKAEDLAHQCGWTRVRIDTCARNPGTSSNAKFIFILADFSPLLFSLTPTTSDSAAGMNKLIKKKGYVQHGDFLIDGKAEGMVFIAYEKILDPR